MNQTRESESAEFLAAVFPAPRELDAIERELKRRARSKPVTVCHSEVVWRLRRGEDVTVDRMVAIYPFILHGLWQQYVDQLRAWGVLTTAAPLLQLEADG